MTLTLYNTLTRRKELFRPIDPANVRVYACGPTVYDFAHIGNARPVIVFDVLFRLLRHLAAKGDWDGGKGATIVTYARNITDVDDKINARAAERYPELSPTDAIRKLTAGTTEQFHKDIRALGVLMPEDVNKPGQPPVFIEPRATQSIAEMRSLIEALVANGHAYVADGHVLFDVPTMPDYGRLANRSLEEMEAGARVDVAPYKKGPMDFVLWKPSKPGEPAWPSPCGISVPGRPGWHIECSAMADRWLWEEAKPKLSAAGLAQPHVFDIHGGGIDLVFPHHENELAQSRCGHGTAVMANVWMHNGHLQVEGEKMSKSLGNFVTINELLQTQNFGGRRWPGGSLRLAMLKTHYRQPINWTSAALGWAHAAHSHWTEVLSGSLNFSSGNEEYYRSEPPSPEMLVALKDDLNTAETITVLHRLANSHDIADHRSLFASGAFLGLWEFDQLAARRERDDHLSTMDSASVEEMIEVRNAARKVKNFKEADRIRDELTAMGVQLKDAKDPATGEIVTSWEVRASGAPEVKR